MITVHHLENSRSMRVIWLLEELSLEYKIKHYKRNAADNLAPEDFKKLHPLGTAPALTDGDFILCETGAIIEYILEKYGEGRLKPKVGTPEHTKYLFWLHMAEGSYAPLLVMRLLFNRMETKAPFLLRPLVRSITGKVNAFYVGPKLEKTLAYIEAELSKDSWFAGHEFSAADIQMGFPLDVAAVRGGLDDRFPHIKAYVKRTHARPAYKAALEKGGALVPLK